MNIEMDLNNKDLKRRIIDISYKNKLSHLGSCLSAVDIIDEIYQFKKADERFVLSSGHAGLALYVVNEKYQGIDAEKAFKHHGVHPDRCNQCHIDCSTGSLGQGLPIAVGMALANREKNVYCLISDGECAEGSIWEALNLRAEYDLANLKVYINLNGWGAYGRIDKKDFKKRLISYGNYSIFLPPPFIWETIVEQLPFLREQDAHYHVMDEEEYNQAMGILK